VAARATKECPICHLEVLLRYYEAHIKSPHNRQCYVTGCDVWCTKTTGSGSAGLARHVALNHPGQGRKRGGYARKNQVQEVPETLQRLWKGMRAAYRLGNTELASQCAWSFHELMCIRHGVMRTAEDK
jgi:hypothetical protein